MNKNLIGVGSFIIIEKIPQEINDNKSSLLLNPEDINPTLFYGKILSLGNYVSILEVGDCIYCSKSHLIEINHNNKKYFAIPDDGVIASIKASVD